MTEVTPVDLLSRARTLKHRVFLARKDSELRAEAMRLRSDPAFLAQYAAAQEGLDVPPLQHHEGVWAIAMVRNEADIIETTVRHLLQQGIDHMLVVDNLSDDDTPRVLARLAEEIPHLHVGTDSEPAYYQSAKMTQLSDLVSAAGARWIIPFDADELWFAPQGRLVDALDDSGSPVRRAHLFNLFPSPGGKQWRLDTARHFDDKVAFRPWGGAVVTMGNHEVSRPGSRTCPGGLSSSSLGRPASAPQRWRGPSSTRGRPTTGAGSARPQTTSYEPYGGSSCPARPSRTPPGTPGGRYARSETCRRRHGPRSSRCWSRWRHGRGRRPGEPR